MSPVSSHLDGAADSEGSEREEESAGGREKLLTRRRGSQQQLLTVSMGLKARGSRVRGHLGESSYNSESEEGGFDSV